MWGDAVPARALRGFGPADRLRLLYDDYRGVARAADLWQGDRAAAALKETRGNRRRAADLLGIGERTLYRKIKEYRLPEHEYSLD